MSLLLARKEKESIIINDNILIKVIEISEEHVLLGVEAPREIQVWRYEIYCARKQGFFKPSGSILRPTPAAYGIPPKLKP